MLRRNIDLAIKARTINGKQWISVIIQSKILLELRNLPNDITGFPCICNITHTLNPVSQRAAELAMMIDQNTLLTDVKDLGRTREGGWTWRMIPEAKALKRSISKRVKRYISRPRKPNLVSSYLCRRTATCVHMTQNTMVIAVLNVASHYLFRL